MKHFATLLILMFSIYASAQTTIASYPISVCEHKTSNLIFPYSIVSVDRGSQDLLAQKAKGAENILQLKAAIENFQPTNLSVITSDGKLFSFIVTYNENPSVLNISLASDSLSHLSGHQIQFTAEKLNDLIMDSDASIVLRQKHFIHQKIFSDGMRLTLKGIYLKDNALWFLFEAKNYSFLDYQPDYLKCFLQDKTKASRRAIQETELPRVYPQAFPKSVPGKNKRQFVLAFDPFTFSKDKKMLVQLSETNGRRLLALSIDHKVILKARLIR
jgi:conjugative transposon TraN protein